MKRSKYFNYIDDKLGSLAYRINIRGKLNILDLHMHSENFYPYLLNQLYGWELKNLNPVEHNIEAIDLIDDKNKYIVQVSATNTKDKIESSLKKEIIKKHTSYTFKFISISKDSKDLRTKTFKNPHHIKFEPQVDIIDNVSILDYLLSSSIDKQKETYQLIKKELGSEIDIEKIDSNLATIINILSKEDLSFQEKPQLNSFEIERKIEFNELRKTKMIIVDYAKYHPRLDSKYVEFDKQGANKSFSVLGSVRKCYVEQCVKLKDKSNDEIFLCVIEAVKENITQSANYIEIPIDELDVCVDIIVVDAFIRCKIFTNPENYKYVTA